MQIDLTLRDAQIIKLLLEMRLEHLKDVNADNYPHRQQDTDLVAKLSQASDPHWNK